MLFFSFENKESLSNVDYNDKTHKINLCDLQSTLTEKKETYLVTNYE